jgi:hypothetical protein
MGSFQFFYHDHGRSSPEFVGTSRHFFGTPVLRKNSVGSSKSGGHAHPFNFYISLSDRNRP